MVAKIAMMKKLFGLFCVILLCQNCLATPVVVKRIVDGDTFMGDVVLSDGTEIMSVAIRVRNVDTPEMHGECDQEIRKARYAKQRLSELIPVGSTIEIKNIKNDKYAGRIDANVYDSANRDVGKILVRENVGRAYSGGKRQSWCK